MADCFDDTDMPVDIMSMNDPVAEAEEDLAEFTLSLKKKKKKKGKKKKGKKAAAAATAATTGAAAKKDGNAWDGTDRDYTYTEMLDRVFGLLRERNPGLQSKKRYTMPPPQLARVGTRKTMWANFPQICQVMHRQQTHVKSFVLAELGTEGSQDGNSRLILKGRYIPKQAESLLKKYIVEYVTCHMCRSPETMLTRDSVTRLYFLNCSACGSKRSVAPIKTGFHATSRSDRRAAKAARVG